MFFKNTSRLLPLLLQLLLSTNSVGQSSPKYIQNLFGPTLSSAQFTVAIQQIMDSLQMPGLSIAIINQRKIVYHQTLGVTNIETHQPVTSRTLFEAASLSKPVFAYFVMKLVEKGIVDLDKPFNPYLTSIFTPGVIDSSSMEAYQLLAPGWGFATRPEFPIGLKTNRSISHLNQVTGFLTREKLISILVQR